MRRRLAGTVPPPVIAANRTLLAALVATNFLGINTPAIMATEAQYAEMWVQDAITMYTYQAASAAAGVLQPLTPATPTTNPGRGGIRPRRPPSATAPPAASGLAILATWRVGGIRFDSDLLAARLTASSAPRPSSMPSTAAVNTAAWFVGEHHPDRGIAGAHPWRRCGRRLRVGDVCTAGRRPA